MMQRERAVQTAIETAADHELMMASLEAVAATDRDIVPLFFARFFAEHPADRANFHNAASSQGTMVNEMLAMLLALAAGEPWVEMMMRAQLRTHDDHGEIALERYRDTLDMLVDILRDTAGPPWNAQWEAIWRRQADRLFALIERHY